MSSLFCEDCGISFRPHVFDSKNGNTKYKQPPFKAGDKCPDCGSTNTHIEEDDEE